MWPLCIIPWGKAQVLTSRYYLPERAKFSSFYTFTFYMKGRVSELAHPWCSINTESVKNWWELHSEGAFCVHFRNTLESFSGVSVQLWWLLEWRLRIPPREREVVSYRKRVGWWSHRGLLMHLLTQLLVTEKALLWPINKVFPGVSLLQEPSLPPELMASWSTAKGNYSSALTLISASLDSSNEQKK